MLRLHSEGTRMLGKGDVSQDAPTEGSLKLEHQTAGDT